MKVQGDSFAVRRRINSGGTLPPKKEKGNEKALFHLDSAGLVNLTH